ncbi:hypothetical protein C5167_012237 [Papaver somniferum]|uniref:Uncharacterized protein n=1 Tax=Papaver somniferum TaxID=3469 RepID=A0A4Y7J151_PAPSO|nr:hypothetical protein C5167_012237 [Papaver somniferum]
MGYKWSMGFVSHIPWREENREKMVDLDIWCERSWKRGFHTHSPPQKCIFALHLDYLKPAVEIGAAAANAEVRTRMTSVSSHCTFSKQEAVKCQFLLMSSCEVEEHCNLQFTSADPTLIYLFATTIT